MTSSSVLEDAFACVWDDVSLGRQQALMRRVLTAAKCNNIRLYLFWGTLLGHVREQGILSWDDDVDLAIFDPSLTDYIELRNSLLADGLEIYDHREIDHVWLKVFDPTYESIPDRPWSWPYVDIFIYAEDAGSQGSQWPAFPFPRDLILPGRPVSFVGLDCMEPQKPLALLDLQYPGWRYLEQSSAWNHRDEAKNEDLASRRIVTDHFGRKIDYRPDYKKTPEGFSVPLVSFIVTNFNYGHFIENCVDSIFAQDYANVECIIVDDASCDDSRARMLAIKDKFKSVILVFNSENLGQTRSCIEGFKKSKGQYIGLIDADDYVLPNFASTHIRTHLAMRNPIGFSSCQMLECIDGQVVLASCTSGDEIDLHSSLLGDKDLGPLPPALFSMLTPDRSTTIRRVNNTNTCWVWGPTSSSVYRRDALRMFLNNPRIGKLKLTTDAYLNYPLNALCGSVLIDEPCAVYRIHGGNNFISSASLSNMKNYQVDLDYGAFAAYCALEHMIMNFWEFHRKSRSLYHLLNVFVTLSRKANQSRLMQTLEMASAKMMRLWWVFRLKFLLPRKR